MTYDTIIVGGGIAGLTAARDLNEAGHRTCVVEGGDRLGGRTWSRPFRGRPELMVEVGGTYIDRHHHPRVAAEIDRYGLRTTGAAPISTYGYALGGGHQDRGLPIPADEALDAERALYTILRDAHRIDVRLGLETQGLEDLDVPLADYLRSLRLPPVTHDLLAAWGWNMMGMHPERSSALWALQFVAAHGHSLLGIVFSLDEIFADGSSDLIAALARDLPDVRTESPVVAIDQDDDGVDVRTADGQTLRGATAIVATPLNTWRTISFGRPLPEDRRAAVQDGHGCRGIKLLIVADGVPAGFSGATYDGLLPTIYDCAAVDETRRLLVAFTDVDSLDPSDREAVERGVHRLLPDARVEAVDYHDWNADPLFAGGWVSPRPGQFSRVHSQLGAPHGRVLFAGSDVSLEFPGYIEGALETAQRAAAEVRRIVSPPAA